MRDGILAGAAIAMAMAAIIPAKANATVEVVSSSQLEFIPLNPARGDASPQAGVLWGDIRKDVPSGVLLKFAKGFSSPPHIHNITYRAVVISGAIHNDDPGAERMWMGPGSFWTQPAGENHITAAQSDGGAMAFLEILKGPYLVKHAKEAFDSGERPVNLDASNIVWLDAGDVNWVSAAAAGSTPGSVEVAYLWGKPRDGEMNGTFLKLPKGFQGKIMTGEPAFRAVLIDGAISHAHSGQPSPTELASGSYFGSNGATEHLVTCSDRRECVVYIRTEGRYQVTSG
ncbi:MAG: DUF4437 domain-containing protein [Pseudomonadota bacterium]